MIMEKQMIMFSFEGKNYEVSMDAYEQDIIVLPDGTLLQVDGWWERIPPRPRALHRFSSPPPSFPQAREV